MLDWLSQLIVAHPEAAISGVIGIAGAVIGSAVTVTWTEFFNWRARRREQRSRMFSLANSMFIKVSNIYADAVQIRDHLAGCIRTAAIKQVMHVFLYTKAMRGSDLRTLFTTDELWMATLAGGPPLINKVTRQDEASAALFAAMVSYDQERDKMMSFFSPGEVSGTEATAGISSDIYQRVRPMMNALDESIFDIHRIASDLAISSYAALEALVHASRRPMGSKFAITVLDPEGLKVELRSRDAPHPKRWWRFRRWGPWWKVWKQQWWRVWRWPQRLWNWFA